MNNNKWNISWIPTLIKENKTEPLYLQIVEALFQDIKTGLLKPGMKVPPVRLLSYALECNIGTVYKAYLEAEKRGLIHGETGRGTFIKGLTLPSSVAWPNESTHNRIIDFSDNFPMDSPQINHFIRHTFHEIADKKNFNHLLQYQYNSAYQPHLEIFTHFLQSYHIPATSETTLITSGALHGGFLSLIALTNPGDLILAEELTSPAIKGMAYKLHLKLKAIPLDKDGINIEKLEKILNLCKPKCLYLVPNIQNPTTAVLNLEKRQRLVQLAQKYNFYIIEDDVFGALIPNKLPNLKSLLPQQVFYTTSFSKSIAPALRIGLLSVPAEKYTSVLNALRISNWMASPLTADIVCNLIENQKFNQIIAMRQQEILRRQEIATTIFKNENFQISPYAMQLFLKLPSYIRQGQFTELLRKNEIAVLNMEDFSVSQANPIHALRITLCSEPNEKVFISGMQRIHELLVNFLEYHF